MVFQNTYSNLFFYELPSIVNLLWCPPDGKQFHIWICIWWGVSLQFYSSTRLLANALDSFTT